MLAHADLVCFSHVEGAMIMIAHIATVKVTTSRNGQVTRKGRGETKATDRSLPRVGWIIMMTSVQIAPRPRVIDGDLSCLQVASEAMHCHVSSRAPLWLKVTSKNGSLFVNPFVMKAGGLRMSQQFDDESCCMSQAGVRLVCQSVLVLAAPV